MYDPSKLHLKRELTQIRKAARVLRDPGTTSSWKSPLSSSRSNNNNHNSSSSNLHFLYHSYDDINHEHLTARNDDNVSPHCKDDNSVERGRVMAMAKEAKEKERRFFLV